MTAACAAVRVGGLGFINVGPLVQVEQEVGGTLVRLALIG